MCCNCLGQRQYLTIVYALVIQLQGRQLDDRLLDDLLTTLYIGIDCNNSSTGELLTFEKKNKYQ